MTPSAVQSAAGTRKRAVLRFLSPYLYAGPAALLITTFSLGAMIVSLVISFYDWNVVSPVKTFVGLEHFRKALADPLTWVALRNTAFYVVGVVPLVMVLSLSLALAVNALPWKSFFRTVAYLPSITPGVVVAFIWLWLYEPEGLLNKALLLLGIKGPNWLMDPRWAMPAVILMSGWASSGYFMVIFLAGLNDIPKSFYEAAKVDGANRWHLLRHITLPLLRNSLIYVTVMLTISSFQVFTQVYIMTRGGPGNSTQVVNLLIFQHAFQFFNMGYAAALSWILFAVVLVLVVFQTRLFASRQIY